MATVLIIGATRGLGLELLKRYASNGSTTVYGTSRSASAPPQPSGANIKWIPSIDLTSANCGDRLSTFLSNEKAQVSTTIITAGYFATETLKDASWSEQQKMYTTSAIAPPIIVSALTNASLIPSADSKRTGEAASKLILVSSESGSITLRHPQEGGGNFGHHGSKAATNMVGKLLSLDLAAQGIAVGIVHPSFMRTEMTKGVGFDKFWDDGAALRPDEAADLLFKWVEAEFGIDKSGQYWAPRGTRDIGTWGAVMGEGREGAVELPW